MQDWSRWWPAKTLRQTVHRLKLCSYGLQPKLTERCIRTSAETETPPKPQKTVSFGAETEFRSASNFARIFVYSLKCIHKIQVNEPHWFANQNRVDFCRRRTCPQHLKFLVKQTSLQHLDTSIYCACVVDISFELLYTKSQTFWKVVNLSWMS